MVVSYNIERGLQLPQTTTNNANQHFSTFIASHPFVFASFRNKIMYQYRPTPPTTIRQPCIPLWCFKQLFCKWWPGFSFIWHIDHILTITRYNMIAMIDFDTLRHYSFIITQNDNASQLYPHDDPSLPCWVPSFMNCASCQHHAQLSLG